MSQMMPKESFKGVMWFSFSFQGTQKLPITITPTNSQETKSIKANKYNYGNRVAEMSGESQMGVDHGCAMQDVDHGCWMQEV